MKAWGCLLGALATLSCSSSGFIATYKAGAEPDPGRVITLPIEVRPFDIATGPTSSSHSGPATR